MVPVYECGLTTYEVDECELAAKVLVNEYVNSIVAARYFLLSELEK